MRLDIDPRLLIRLISISYLIGARWYNERGVTVGALVIVTIVNDCAKRRIRLWSFG